MELENQCDCCTNNLSTRVCLSCNPEGPPVYMCGACCERAHFGPMKFSHKVESLVNKRITERILKTSDKWVTINKQKVQICVSDLEGCLNDIENQKRTDIDIVNAAFEPIKMAVVKRKKVLISQIMAYYDNIKLDIEKSITECKQYVKSMDQIASDIENLDETLPDDIYQQHAGLIEYQMSPFDPVALKKILPELQDGHQVSPSCTEELSAVISHIENCSLTTSSSAITDELISSLTVAPGDTMEVLSNRMDKDGIFWLKLNIPVDKMTELYKMAFNCRQRLILGESKRYSEHPDELHTGMVVMVHKPEDQVWSRAIVTDPCVGDHDKRHQGAMATVIIADSGSRLDVPHTHLAECCHDDLKIPYLALPCSLYPGDHPPLGNEPKWLFNDCITGGKPKVFNAKFVHRKTDQYVSVPVWYVELTDKTRPDVILNKLVEDKRAACSVAKGSINHKDIRVTAGEITESRRELCAMKDDSSAVEVTADVTQTPTDSQPDGAKQLTNDSPGKEAIDATPESKETAFFEDATDAQHSHTDKLDLVSNLKLTTPDIVGETQQPSVKSEATKSDVKSDASAEQTSSSINQVQKSVGNSEVLKDSNITPPDKNTHLTSNPPVESQNTLNLSSTESTESQDCISGSYTNDHSENVESSATSSTDGQDDPLSEAASRKDDGDETDHRKPKKRKSKKQHQSSQTTSSKDSVDKDAEGDCCESESSDTPKASRSPGRVCISGRLAIRNWITSPSRATNCQPSLAGESPPITTTDTVQQVTQVTNENSNKDNVTRDLTEPMKDNTAARVVHQSSNEVGAENCETDSWNESFSQLIQANEPSTEQQHVASVSDSNQVVRRCFKCGMGDHLLKHCPSTGKVPPHYSPCSICGEKNHPARSCFKARDVYYQNGCPYCLNWDHRLVTCPKHHEKIDFVFLKKDNKFQGKRGGRSRHHY